MTIESKKYNAMMCEATQDYLLSGQPSPDNPDHRALIEAHLRVCPECQAFQKTILLLAKATEIPESSSLTPKPEIRTMALQKLGAKPEPAPLWHRLLYFVQGMLQYRIPAYQAILAGSVCTLLLIGFLALPQKPYMPTTKAAKANSTRLTDSLLAIGNIVIGTSVQADPLKGLCDSLIKPGY